MSTVKLSCSGHTRREKAGSLEDGDAEENERQPGKETARGRADFVKEAGGRSTGLRAGRGGCDPFTGVGADASARNARSSESRPTFGRIRKTGGCPALRDHTRHEALGGGRLPGRETEGLATHAERAERSWVRCGWTYASGRLHGSKTACVTSAN